MSVARLLASALGASLVLVGAVSHAQADRNRYTGLRPGQYYDEYGYARYHGRRFIPYAYSEGGPGYGYGYGYRRGYDDGGYGFGGYSYSPRFDDDDEPY